MFRAVSSGALLSLAFSLFAPAQTTPSAKPAKTAFDKPVFEEYLRHQFLLPPQVKVEIGDPKPSDVPGLKAVEVMVTDGGPNQQTVQFYVSADGQKILQGRVSDINQSPFAQELRTLRPQGNPSFGPETAPVTIVIFSDFQCQYCREEAKSLRSNLALNYPTQVRLVFKDFPLEAIHNWAKSAAITGRCIYKQDAAHFWEFHDWIFEQQPTVTVENLKARTLEFANQNSIDTLQLTQCIDTQATSGEVALNTAEAHELQIASTPTMFVNGRRLVGNVAWQQLKTVIDHEIEYAKKTEAEKEPCCEVKLPIPVKP